MKTTPDQVSPIELRRNPPRLLNFPELCIVLDVSERHARSLIAARKIASIRIGRRLLFDRDRLLNGLEKLSTGGIR